MAKKYWLSRKYSRKGRSWTFLIAAAIVLLILGVGVVRVVYIDNLKPVSSSTLTQYFTVPSGTSVDQIALNLKQSGFIRSTSAFKNYIRTNELNDKLQAGTYKLSPSMSVQRIVQKMISGDVARNLLTILPGKRLDQIKQTFSDNGYSSADVATAFNPQTYLGDSMLTYLPSGASLEGFLYPDSFQKSTDTPASYIVKESLDEMAAKLTSDIKNGFANHGLSVYQGITLASIVYQESDNASYESTIAQVFLSRIAQNIALQSNVTADYAADVSGLPRSTNIDSPYNTYLQPGLPPGPIGNTPQYALEAVAHPSNSDYLYFVADENTHQVFFSHTQAEHDALAKQHCPNTCQ